MITATHISHTDLDTRGGKTKRKKVDAYFVAYQCPPDEINSTSHEWMCKFEVSRGSTFVMQNFASKAEARANSFT